MKPFSGAVLQLVGRFDDGIDYANSRKADVLSITPALEYNFSRHFNFNLAHVFERLSFGGSKIYTANLLQGKLVYNFNVRTFVRAIVQYQNLARDPELYGFPVAKTSDSVFTQFLFSYKINPQTVLFLGYSDNSFGMQGIDITRDRQDVLHQARLRLDAIISTILKSNLFPSSIIHTVVRKEIQVFTQVLALALREQIGDNSLRPDRERLIGVWTSVTEDQIVDIKDIAVLERLLARGRDGGRPGDGIHLRDVQGPGLPAGLPPHL